MEIVQDYVYQGNLRQYSDPAFVNELVDWVRFNKREAMNSLDGLFSRCSGNPEVPRWLGQIVVRRTKPKQQAASDTKKLRSSAGVVVIASTSEEKVAWVKVGQVYERLALQMTALNIKSALLNQPIEVSDLRSEFSRAIGLGTIQPQLLMRFGYTPEAMPRSMRRPLSEVLIES